MPAAVNGSVFPVPLIPFSTQRWPFVFPQLPRLLLVVINRSVSLYLPKNDPWTVFQVAVCNCASTSGPNNCPGTTSCKQVIFPSFLTEKEDFRMSAACKMTLLWEISSKIKLHVSFCYNDGILVIVARRTLDGNTETYHKIVGIIEYFSMPWIKRAATGFL